MCDCKKRSMRDKVVCGCSSGRMPRFLRPCLLLFLSDGPSHGYQLIEKMKESRVLDKDPDTGAVYRMLRAMEKEGLIASKWDTKKAGPGRRVYMIRPKGQKVLAEWQQNMSMTKDSLARFLSYYKKHSA